MVARIWHGYTTPSNADLYEQFLKKEFLPSIEKKKIKGYRKFQLLRRSLNDEISFTTIMWFDSLDNIKSFAGADYEKAVVHPTAHGLLKRYDPVAQHYELTHELQYND